MAQNLETVSTNKGPVPSEYVTVTNRSTSSTTSETTGPYLTESVGTWLDVSDFPTLSELEKRYIQTLTAGSKFKTKVQVAETLGVSVQTLYKKLNEYNNK